MERLGDCVVRRLVSLCYGSFDDGQGVCVALATVGPSPYRSGRYMALSFVKWHLLVLALRVSAAALYVDADALLLRNPFAAWLQDAPRTSPDDWDVLYAAETECAVVRVPLCPRAEPLRTARRTTCIRVACAVRRLPARGRCGGELHTEL